MLKQVAKKDFSRLALSLSLLARTLLWDKVGTEHVVLFRCMLNGFTELMVPGIQISKVILLSFAQLGYKLVASRFKFRMVSSSFPMFVLPGVILRLFCCPVDV